MDEIDKFLNEVDENAKRWDYSEYYKTKEGKAYLLQLINDKYIFNKETGEMKERNK